MPPIPSIGAIERNWLLFDKFEYVRYTRECDNARMVVLWVWLSYWREISASPEDVKCCMSEVRFLYIVLLVILIAFNIIYMGNAFIILLKGYPYNIAFNLQWMKFFIWRKKCVSFPRFLDFSGVFLGVFLVFCFLRITNFQIYDVMIDITAYFKMNFLFPLLNAFEY